ncbi:MAG TPA: TIGR03960 family B12-binding radical SAM protein [Phycisphaerae bacterium]|nr:TIGR03960 family B12-binding radical SAM protein [Phycisphaerae bacterium]
MRNVGNLVSQKLLPQVSHPAQYIGLEANRRCGNVEKAGVTVVLAFADAYSVGISHLGSQVLYTMLNSTPGAACDRAYCPMPDAEAVMRAEGIPLFGWESRCAVGDFNILGFSLAYELCATNVLTMLDLAGIPIHAADRRERDPLVVGGDALADSPEPLADFFDLFLVGDGEEPLSALVKLVGEMKLAGASRGEIILQAARTIPATYAPQFYQPQRVDGSPLPVPRRTRQDVPETIRRAHVASLSDSPAITAPLVPVAEGIHERVMIEIMRGCPNGCRFCQAGHTRLPVRWRSVDEIVNIARKAVAATGFDEISLLSLSSSDYPQLNELIDRLNAQFAGRCVSISLPSLRVDSQLKALPKLTSAVRKGGLTIAAEAGSDRLRRAIRKDISEEDMLAGVRAAYEAGWRKVKVYFMAGLPGETDADIEAIFDLCRRLSETGREVIGRPGAISASVSWFVPKPHTPMQWCAMRDAEYLLGVRRRLRELARRSPVSFKFHWVERSLLEGVIARGDRRVGKTIEAAWRAGARMDSWNEHFDYAKWTAAFEQTHPTPSSIANVELPLDAPLPWSHITGHRSEDFLRKEYQRLIEAGAE